MIILESSTGRVGSYSFIIEGFHVHRLTVAGLLWDPAAVCSITSSFSSSADIIPTFQFNVLFPKEKQLTLAALVASKHPQR
jgi:hypothetical protein